MPPAVVSLKNAAGVCGNILLNAFADHTITTHGTDAQGNRTTNTSVVTTKSGNIPIDLDPYFEDITPKVPPALAKKDHATELELHETFQCSPQLELYRRAIKAAVDAQWRNFDSGCTFALSLICSVLPVCDGTLTAVATVQIAPTSATRLSMWRPARWDVAPTSASPTKRSSS